MNADKGEGTGCRQTPEGSAQVTIQQLRKAHETKPFKPFTLRKADGREFPVPHPEFLWIIPAGRTIAVADQDGAADIIDLLDKAANEGLNEDAEAALHETLDMMACKAAIKAGDRLSQEELADLLRSRETVERASSCPHGRPTTLRLTIADLDKQFGRR